MSNTKLLHGIIDVTEAASKKVTGILRSQVLKLEGRGAPPATTSPTSAPTHPTPDPGEAMRANGPTSAQPSAGDPPAAL